MGFRQSLAANLQLDIDFRTGTYADQSANAHTVESNTIGTESWKNGKYGRLLQCTNSAGSEAAIYTATDANMISFPTTWVVFCEPPTVINENRTLMFSAGVSTALWLMVTSSGISMNDGSTTRTLAATIPGKRMIAMTMSAANSTPKIYLDGMLAGSMSGALNVATTATSVYVQNDFGPDYPSMMPFYEAMIFNAELSATQIESMYDDWILERLPTGVAHYNFNGEINGRNLLYANDFRDYPVTFLGMGGPDLGGLRYISGSQKILDDGTDRWFTGVSNGSFYARRSSSAELYGTWQFDFYKVTGTSSIYFYLALDLLQVGVVDSSYFIQIDADEAIRLFNIVGGVPSPLFASANSYIALSTKYSLRVLREEDGEFSIYIRGGAYTSWTLIPASSGSNPVTDLEFADPLAFWGGTLDQDDRISNIKIYRDIYPVTIYPEL